MTATVDHVELSATYLVLGLKIDWCNETNNPIPIKEIHLTVYMGGWGEEPLRFDPLERFERVLTHWGVQKTPVRPFTLTPHEIYTEQIRFISRQVLDIGPGSYAADIQLTDTGETSYINRIEIRVQSEVKHHRKEEWQEEEE